MAVPEVNINLPKGNTKTWILTVSQGGSPINLGSDIGNGTPMNAVLWFTVKQRANDLEEQALIKASTTDGKITIADQATNKGQALIRIPRADTLKLDAPLKGVYDVQMRTGTDPNYEYTTVVKGNFDLEGTVTTRIT